MQSSLWYLHIYNGHIISCISRQCSRICFEIRNNSVEKRIYDNAFTIKYDSAHQQYTSTVLLYTFLSMEQIIIKREIYYNICADFVLNECCSHFNSNFESGGEFFIWKIFLWIFKKTKCGKVYVPYIVVRRWVAALITSYIQKDNRKIYFSMVFTFCIILWWWNMFYYVCQLFVLVDALCHASILVLSQSRMCVCDAIWRNIVFPGILRVWKTEI